VFDLLSISNISPSELYVNALITTLSNISPVPKYTNDQATPGIVALSGDSIPVLASPITDPGSFGIISHIQSVVSPSALHSLSN
jgi:hypothetical protein